MIVISLNGGTTYALTPRRWRLVLQAAATSADGRITRTLLETVGAARKHLGGVVVDPLSWDPEQVRIAFGAVSRTEARRKAERKQQRIGAAT